jgi:hypothetical protein
VVLGRVDGVSRPFQSKELAFDAQQFRQAPTGLGTLASLERLVNGHARLSRLPGSRHTLGQRAEK